MFGEISENLLIPRRKIVVSDGARRSLPDLPAEACARLRGTQAAWERRPRPALLSTSWRPPPLPRCLRPESLAVWHREAVGKLSAAWLPPPKAPLPAASSPVEHVA